MFLRSVSKKFIIMTIIVVLFPFFSLEVSAGGGPGDKPILEPIRFEPSSPAKAQKKIIPVEGKGSTNIGIYIYQLDNMRWRVDGECNGQTLSNNPSTNKPTSSVICIDLSLEAPSYQAQVYMDRNDEAYRRSDITSTSLSPRYMDNTAYYEVGKPILLNVEAFTEKRAKFNMQIGGSIEPTAYRPYNLPKYSADYIFFTDLYWFGQAEITKEINLTPGGQIGLNQMKQLQATVKTKTGDGSFGAETNVNTGSGGTTTWESSNPAVATVSSSGRVQAISRGTTYITVLWKKDGFELTTRTAISVEQGTGGEDDEHNEGGDSGGKGGCTPSIEAPTSGATMNMSHLEPNATGVIKSDNRDNETFDVLKGIPTSESLYTNAFANHYLFKQAWTKMRGKVTYDCSITISYDREWTVPGPQICNAQGCRDGTPVPRNDTVTKPYSFQITRDYSYWVISNLEVYRIAKAMMKNYALPGETITMNPSGYVAPVLESRNDSSVESHVRPGQSMAISYTPTKLTGGLDSPPDVPDDSDLLKGKAEANTPQSTVKNDLVKFNNVTIMNDAETTKDGPTPADIPPPSMIGRDVLYTPNHRISSSLLNKANTESSGQIYYDLLSGNVNGGMSKVFPINGINTVTVHTPVVNYAWVSDDQPHNQKTVPDPTLAALILEREFIVRVPTTGQHLDAASYPGYGNRDYAQYFRTKQVLFPFDVYTADRSRFIPSHTWIDIPVQQLDTSFYLPVWVDEGKYTIEFRNIAENAPANYTGQPDANTNLVHHTASDRISVDVIGRLYDFHVTDISDYNWEHVFRRTPGSPEHTGSSYWTGFRNIDGDPRSPFAPFVLPVRPGSHPVQGFGNVAVKTGYHFKFDLKTKGNMFGKMDGIRVTPTFSFISRDGSSREDVDLYYHRGQERLIQIGSAQDLEKRYVVLNSRLRNVPGIELSDAARYEYTYELSADERRRKSLAEHMVQVVAQTSHQKTWTGRYNWMILTAPIRTLIGPKTNLPASVSADRVNAAIQRWYGEYSLPADVYAVPKGTNLEALSRKSSLDEKSTIFLKNGYIIVNFNIESVRNGNTAAPHLQYIHAPLMNQWQLEGFHRSPANSNGSSWPLRDGDILFYDASQSSRSDFQAQAPH